jgi:hypothetical protein
MKIAYIGFKLSTGIAMARDCRDIDGDGADELEDDSVVLWAPRVIE